MPRKAIAVVIAMRRELAPLLRGVKGQRINGIEFFELRDAVIAVSGIGRIPAKKTAEAVIEKYEPTTVISAGIAGALTTTLQVGDVVLGSEIVDAKDGMRFSTVAGGEAVIVTVSSVSNPAGKLALADRYKADVVDMESAAVAAVARKSGLEFIAIKAISDELEFEMPPLSKFVDGNGKFGTASFVAYIAVRPKWWPAVRQLSANSDKASVNLSHAVKHLIEVHANDSQEERIPRA